MLSRRRFSVLAALAAPGVAAAQTPWPSKPIRWIVNFPPAGAADILSRTLAEYFGSRLGQPIVVENKPGAGGMLGADIVAKARGDTHVVMMSSAASHGIGPVLYKDVPYDPLARLHAYPPGRDVSQRARRQRRIDDHDGRSSSSIWRAASPARSPMVPAATAR